jgi:hypothetical protein
MRVSTVIDAPPAVVWEEVRHIDRHVDWMADAERITFTSRRRSGVGTTFDCLTKVGLVRLTDRMEITEWRDGKVIGVQHVGIVTGTGRFTVTKARGGRTRFTWDERLRFPWWLGGPVGAVAGGRVLRRIWKRNLRVLKALVESGRAELPRVS